MGDQDVSNFTPPSSHRLPTVSASEALKSLSASRGSAVSTGLPQLDQILQGKDVQELGQGTLPGGLVRGQITEVYGPPGVGKTTLA
ncbi:hypothetical protein MMC26_004622 [Xylographa opegraphella]|nr:hypothetical protein [Xylographa opegraphella]